MFYLWGNEMIGRWVDYRIWRRCDGKAYVELASLRARKIKLSKEDYYEYASGRVETNAGDGAIDYDAVIRIGRNCRVGDIISIRAWLGWAYYYNDCIGFVPLPEIEHLSK